MSLCGYHYYFEIWIIVFCHFAWHVFLFVLVLLSVLYSGFQICVKQQQQKIIQLLKKKRCEQHCNNARFTSVDEGVNLSFKCAWREKYMNESKLLVNALVVSVDFWWKFAVIVLTCDWYNTAAGTAGTVCFLSKALHKAALLQKNAVVPQVHRDKSRNVCSGWCWITQWLRVWLTSYQCVFTTFKVKWLSSLPHSFTTVGQYRGE